MNPDYKLIQELFDIPGAGAPEAPHSTARGKKGRDSEHSRRLGGQAMSDGDYEAAIEHFKRAVEQSNELSPWPLMDLGAAYSTTDQVPQAFRQYLKAKRIQKSGELSIALAALYSQMGRSNDAINELRESVQLEPENAYTHHKLAAALRRAGYRTEAVQAGQVAIACAPDQAFYHYWLGEYFLELKRYKDAIDALHAAIELSPGDDRLFFLAAQAFWGAKRPQEAIRAVRLASDLDPDNPMYHGLLRAFLKASGHDEEAELETKKTSKMDAYDHEMLGRVFKHLKLAP